MYRQTKKVQKYGFIKKLEDQTYQLAQKKIDSQRQGDPFYQTISNQFNSKGRPPRLLPTLLKYSDFNKCFIRKPQSAVLANRKDQKFKMMLQEKKETTLDFVVKKREIFRSNMNISVKKEETNHLEDMIKNEQESLKAREIDIAKDEKLVKKFVQSVKNAADEAQKQVEDEQKKKEEKTLKYNQLVNYEEKLKAEKDKLSEELEGLSIYKDFIQTLAKHKFNISSPKSQQQFKNSKKSNKTFDLFVTEQENQPNQQNPEEKKESLENEEEFLIFDSSEQVLELLNQMEDNNIHCIQTQSEIASELELKSKELEEKRAELAQHKRLHDANRQEFDKIKETILKKRQALKLQLEIFDTNKMQINEGSTIDMDILSKIIMEIAQYIEQAKENSNNANSNTNKENQDQKLNKINGNNDLAEIKRCLYAIEEKFQTAARKINEQKLRYPKTFTTKEKEINEYIKMKKRDKEQAERQRREQLEKLAKLKKKEQAQAKARFGRRPMGKTYLNTGDEEDSQEDEEQVDEMLKYLRESFELGQDTINEEQRKKIEKEKELQKLKKKKKKKNVQQKPKQE